MAVKVENVVEGDVVEVALTPDARRFTEAYYFYLPDPGHDTDIPGRTHVGYVSGLENDSIWLSQEQNKVNPKKTSMGSVRYYFTIMESWRKL